jgi:lipopolysaccharide export system protein LptC
MTLYAKDLKIDLLQGLASTDNEVKIVGKNSNIDATGMLIEFDAGKLTFNARTRAEYAPN